MKLPVRELEIGLRSQVMPVQAKNRRQNSILPPVAE
jgi:hypothetical protein